MIIIDVYSITQFKYFTVIRVQTVVSQVRDKSVFESYFYAHVCNEAALQGCLLFSRKFD